jgi:hypothetical protein
LDLKRNKHHWQYWVLVEDEGGYKVLDIPSRYRREMLADWIGAGRALGYPRLETWLWYQRNSHKMRLHPETRAWVEQRLRSLS